MALGNKILKIRNQQGLSQSQLIQKLKSVTPESEHDKLQGAISNLERRDSSSSKYTAAIAEVLGVSIYSLLTDDDPILQVSESSSPKYGDEDDDVVLFSRSQSKEMREENKTPLLSWVQAGEFCLSGWLYNQDEVSEWRDCPVKHSKRTFVLTITGTSMEPRYPEGSEIFVDPMIQAEHNDDVIVCDPDGRTTFKRLKITPDGNFLEALNPDFPSRIILVPEGSRICGVVIYKGEKTR